MGVLVLTGLGSVVSVGLVADHRRAQSAADLAALAGAGVLASGGDACVGAAANASRNDARLVQCQVDATSILVSVEVTGRLSATLRVGVRAQARAGWE